MRGDLFRECIHALVLASVLFVPVALVYSWLALLLMAEVSMVMMPLTLFLAVPATQLLDQLGSCRGCRCRLPGSISRPLFGRDVTMRRGAKMLMELMARPLKVPLPPRAFIIVVRAGVRPSPLAVAGSAINHIPTNMNSVMYVRTGTGSLAQIGVDIPMMMMIGTWSAEFRESVAQLRRTIVVISFTRMT